MNRPKGIAVALALAFIFAWAGTGACQDEEKTIEVRPGAKTKAVFGFHREFPPFSFERDGEPVGFDIDLLRAILSRFDVQLTMKPMDWRKIVDNELSGGLIDLTSGMVPTKQRLLLFSFPDHSSANIKIKLYTQVDDRVGNLSQLRGKRVSVKKNSHFYNILAGFGGLNLKQYESNRAALKALFNGEVEAYGGPDKTSDYYIRKLDLGGVSPVGTPLEVTKLYFALNRDRKDLLEMVNKGMREIRENGEYDQIFRKWFVEELTDEEREVMLAEAAKARLNAYAPYSGKPRGAVALGRSGKVYHGCTIENRQSSLNTSALKAAVFQAVVSGESEIKAVLAVDESGKAVTPSAEERQILYEFGLETLVVTEPYEGEFVIRTIGELLPYAER